MCRHSLSVYLSYYANSGSSQFLSIHHIFSIIHLTISQKFGVFLCSKIHDSSFLHINEKKKRKPEDFLLYTLQYV
jgi:hypothetical protein